MERKCQEKGEEREEGQNTYSFVNTDVLTTQGVERGKREQLVAPFFELSAMRKKQTTTVRHKRAKKENKRKRTKNKEKRTSEENAGISQHGRERGRLGLSNRQFVHPTNTNRSQQKQERKREKKNILPDPASRGAPQQLGATRPQ